MESIIIAVPLEESRAFRTKVLNTLFDEEPELHRISDYPNAHEFYDYYGFIGNAEDRKRVIEIFRDLKKTENWVSAPMWYVE